MPELPDLEVFSKNLSKRLKGKIVKKISILNKKKIKTPATKFKKALEKQELKRVYRSGKQLHFQFSNGNVLAIHMMLHGYMYLFENKNQHKYTIIEMLFEDNSGLALTDFQGQATPMLNPENSEAPDALSKEINFKLLKQIFDSKAAVKTALMDQHLIRGIGNAYADEILWDARISPFSVSNKIPDNKIKELVKSIKKVLKNAKKQITKKQPDIISGEIRDFLLIHNSYKTHSPKGATIRRKAIKGRKTYYTEEQELYK